MARGWGCTSKERVAVFWSAGNMLRVECRVITQVCIFLKSWNRTLEMDPFGNTLKPTCPPRRLVAVASGHWGSRRIPKLRWSFWARQALDTLVKPARFAPHCPWNQIRPSPHSTMTFCSQHYLWKNAFRAFGRRNSSILLTSLTAYTAPGCFCLNNNLSLRLKNKSLRRPLRR